MARLTSLTFNLDPTAHDGCLALRQNLTGAPRRPEWEPTNPDRSPVAYALADLGGAAPRVRVEVERTASDGPDLEVRALTVGTGPAPLPPAFLLQPDLLWPATHWFVSLEEYAAAVSYRAYYRLWEESREPVPHVLGPVPVTRFHLGATGSTTAVVVPLSDARLGPRGVGATDAAWRWEARPVGGTAWDDLGVSEHRVYTVLAAPTQPWRPYPQTPSDTQIPWVDALEVACRWAAGSRDPEEAATAVTESVNALGPGVLEYGCPILALTMYASPFGEDTFDCTAFLDLLSGGDGNGRFVNCTDCATIVSTFANLLGADLWQSRMGALDPPFLTNPLLAIGSSRLGSPCGWGLGFTYHEVAWVGACDEDDEVYDACVRFVPQDVVPVGRSFVPSGMRFGAAGDDQYRDLLAAPTDRSVCVPRPQERVRRSVH